MERLRKLQYKSEKKLTRGYHGSRQDLIVNLEDRTCTSQDMGHEGAARIIEKGYRATSSSGRRRQGNQSGAGAVWTTLRRGHRPKAHTTYNTSPGGS